MAKETIGLGAQTRNTAAEMQQSILARGAKLPELTSSPSVAAAEAAAEPKENSSQREIFAKLRKDSQEIERLRKELESAQSSSSSSKGGTVVVTKIVEVQVPSGSSSTASAAPAEAEEGGSGFGLLVRVIYIYIYLYTNFLRLLKGFK